jgi:L-ribulokinase
VSAASARRFAIGVDYGTNSVRALVVDVDTGAEVGTHVFDYPSGEDGVLIDARDPQLARQNPADYVEGFHVAVREAMAAAAKADGFAPDRVLGVGVDTTGSTPMPVDAEGVPLALHQEFADNLAAHAWLWKDHTAWAEAAEITEAAREHPDAYLTKCGGTYSSEWYWAKILRCKRAAPEVFAAAASWVELADFVPAYITGNTDPKTMARGICAAGHKAMYAETWGGLPARDFLESLDPDLGRLRDCYASEALTADCKAGDLSPAVAEQVGLPAGIAVAVGAFDAHMGAVGAGIEPGTLVKIIGTSTCDMMVAPRGNELPDVPGLCGIVPGSVIPGMYGLEAGQSAVGDIFNWFASHLAPAAYAAEGDKHTALTAAAERLRPGESGLLALDWNNGNRTVLVDHQLTGLLVGQTLHTTAPEVYRALVEATAFGALTIINRFEAYGLAVDEVVNCGGIAEKNPFVMQVYADVTNRPMKISRSAQTCALGAALFGAVAAGAHPDVPTAQAKMTGCKDEVFQPRREAAAVYADLYILYKQLHDAFGGVAGHGAAGGASGGAEARPSSSRSSHEPVLAPAAMGRIMKDLIGIRDGVRGTGRGDGRAAGEPTGAGSRLSPHAGG